MYIHTCAGGGVKRLLRVSLLASVPGLPRYAIIAHLIVRGRETLKTLNGEGLG